MYVVMTTITITTDDAVVAAADIDHIDLIQ